MALSPGTRLGAFEISARIGVGGMGEVYRARDTKLNRDVAIKVLPDEAARDPERLTRFDREAKTLAALNHPHIAQIYGIEDAGHSKALVMELVEGPTLADRILAGPIPVREALPIARQIAEALEAAHEQGIIHRDLKPGNVKVRSDGTVKVLDFGLAKVLQPAADPTSDSTESMMAAAPTSTRQGVILGTSAYMSPEQIRAQPLDKRTDIWAFGCVLFEMLTGRRTFEADTVGDTFARVLTNEPAWDLLPASTTGPVRRVLRRCLAKDRRQRLSDGAAVRLELEDMSGAVGSDPVAEAATASSTSRRTMLPALAMLVGAVIAGLAVWLVMRPPPPAVSRLTIAPSATSPLTIDGSTRDVAIAPDGTRVVYASGAELYVRAMNALEPLPLGKGAWARPQHPVFSPDGQWIAFFDGIGLRKIAATGGPTQDLARTQRVAQGVSWGESDSIVFATADPRIGLQHVSANGGDPETLTTPDAKAGEVDHVWPSVLPGGRGVLFTITTAGGAGQSQVAVFDRSTGTYAVLVRGGSDAQFVAPEFLVYASGTSLRAVRFDLDRLQIIGPDIAVLDDVGISIQSAVNASVAATGTFVYVPAGAVSAGRTLVWVDRDGNEDALGAPARGYVYPRLSPDGAQLAVYAFDDQFDIWLWDLGRRLLTRSTFDSDADIYPVWTPDGRRVVRASGRTGPFNLFRQSADGTGVIERLAESERNQIPTAMTADGIGVVFREEDRPLTGSDLMLLRLDTRQVTALLATPAAELNGEVSPNGQWLAYESDQGGQFEIYVRPFPDTASGGPWQISTGGGRQALWARNGRELFYRSSNGAVMAAPIDANGTVFRAGAPRRVIDGPYFTGMGGHVGRTYDVAPDGSRFLMIKDHSVGSARVIHVVLNWPEELKRLLPAN